MMIRVTKTLIVVLTAALLPFSGAAFLAPLSALEPLEPPALNFQPVQPGPAFNDEIIVKFRSETPEIIDQFVQKHSIATFKKRLLGANTIKFRENQDLLKKLDQLRQDPNVEYAEPNYTAYALAAPNDPYFNYQWSFGPNSLDMAKVWDIATGRGVVVAVIDTGVAYENYKNFKQAPDLAQTSIAPGRNFVSDTSHANDDNGHGTHIAGTIAQSTNNGLGVAGIAYNASIMPIKVLDKRGAGSYADIADGLVFAASNGAHIVNLSLGGPSPSETLRRALDYAKSKGVFIVAASGNDGGNTVSYPAAYNDYVMAVGATRYDKTVTKYSNRGTALDVVAPGGDTKVDQDANGYGDGILQQTFTKSPTSFGYYFFQGTSMAAPHVAATAALLREKGITNPDEIQQILQNTADDIGAAGWDSTSGYGIINPLKALQGLNQLVQTQPTTNGQSPSPSPTPTSTPSPSPSPSPSLHISSISLSLRSTVLRVRAVAKVQVVDGSGNPVPGAQVLGKWSGLTSQEGSAITDSSGIATLSTHSIRKTYGKFTFEVQSLELDGYEYRPEDNKISSGEIVISRKSSMRWFQNPISAAISDF